MEWAPQSFVDTILDDPAKDGPRLVLADWWEERGDKRAEGLRESGFWRVIAFPIPKKHYPVSPGLIWYAFSNVLVPVAEIVDRRAYCSVCRDRIAVAFWGRWICGQDVCLHGWTLTTETVVARMVAPNAKRCPSCSIYSESFHEIGCCQDCYRDGVRRSRRGWRQLGVYDG